MFWVLSFPYEAKGRLIIITVSATFELAFESLLPQRSTHPTFTISILQERHFSRLLRESARLLEDPNGACGPGATVSCSLEPAVFPLMSSEDPNRSPPIL